MQVCRSSSHGNKSPADTTFSWDSSDYERKHDSELQRSNLYDKGINFRFTHFKNEPTLEYEGTAVLTLLCDLSVQRVCVASPLSRLR